MHFLLGLKVASVLWDFLSSYEWFPTLRRLITTGLSEELFCFAEFPELHWDAVVVPVVSGFNEGHHHACSSRGDEETGAEVSGKSSSNQLQSADRIRPDQGWEFIVLFSAFQIAVFRSLSTWQFFLNIVVPATSTVDKTFMLAWGKGAYK